MNYKNQGDRNLFMDLKFSKIFQVQIKLSSFILKVVTSLLIANSCLNLNREGTLTNRLQLSYSIYGELVFL